MVGGASGSAVINDDYQVVGIYWGGYEYAYDLENEIYFFLPCIDAFNAVFSWNTNSKFLTGQL
jgi:hypothetical protein